MTKSKAIKILEEFIKYKQSCLEIMNQGTFKTDVGEIRKQLVEIYEGDKKTLERALLELKSTKDSKETEKPAKEDLLSLEMKKVIADEVTKAISEYKKNNSKTPRVVVSDSKRKKKSL